MTQRLGSSTLKTFYSGRSLQAIIHVIPGTGVMNNLFSAFRVSAISSFDRAIPSRKPAAQANHGNRDKQAPEYEDSFVSAVRASVQQTKLASRPYEEHQIQDSAPAKRSQAQSPVHATGMVKSESLEELRSRGGLVADVKGVFNKDREPGRQVCKYPHTVNLVTPQHFYGDFF